MEIYSNTITEIKDAPGCALMQHTASSNPAPQVREKVPEAG